MSHLVVRDGHLLRKGTSAYHLLRLPEFPTAEISHHNAPAFYKYEQWVSERYDDPDDVNLSAAASGVSSQLAAANWAGTTTDRNYAFSYWFQSGTGPYRTYIRAQQMCVIADVSRYAGLLADVRVYVASYTNSPGAGSFHIGLAALASPTPGLSYTASHTVTGTGYYTFSGVRLGAYLRLGCQVAGCRPPDAEGAPHAEFRLWRSFLYVLTGV